MGILLLICFAILALPYLIRERLCHVLPLYATTATGRKLFDRQFQALVACCGFVGIVQFGIYVLVYGIKRTGGILERRLYRRYGTAVVV